MYRRALTLFQAIGDIPSIEKARRVLDMLRVQGAP
jgi:hypothetical protein